ncbi:MAG: hypothetical protein GY778_18490 [bacterium]|nr:hypothetical protein [bacterium]
MAVDRDPPTNATMATQTDAGFIVANARDPSGETWQVWAADASAAVCELAGQVGFELDDG